MEESYVPQEANVVCTHMTNGFPLSLELVSGGDHFSTDLIKHTEKSAPLLNIAYKQLSGSFSCKTSNKFWYGMSSLCIAISIACIVVVAVASAAAIASVLILPVAAMQTLLATTASVIAVVSALVGIGAMIKGVYDMNNSCNVTSGQKWLLFHDTVKIGGANALLDHSHIECTNGGIVHIIVDTKKANTAAAGISGHNVGEVWWHVSSQAVIGGLTVWGGALGLAPGLIISTVLAVPLYILGERTPITIAIANIPIIDQNTDLDEETPILGDAAETIIGEALEAGLGAASESLPNTITGAGRHVAETGFLAKLKPTGGGLLLSAAAFVVGAGSDFIEGKLEEGAKKALSENDGSGSGISVVAEETLLCTPFF